MKLASIEKITKVFVHPNADKLEFVHILGYDCIVPKGLYSVGELAILIQPDTVLPTVDWTEIYRKVSSKRVKAIRLRGEWSLGIVEKTSLLPENLIITEGLEVSEFLHITKYEPPTPNELNAKGFLPFGIAKTGEERYQNLVLEEYWGKKVDVTLKVDGQSFTAYYKDGEFGVCGRALEYRLDSTNDFTIHAKQYELEEKLRHFHKKYDINIALRGENYGRGVQSSKTNPHSQRDKGLVFFSVWLIDKRPYAYKDVPLYIRKVAKELDLPLVPIIESDVALSSELIKKYDQELEKLDQNMFEGVVLVGNSFSFKVINKYYDSHK